MTVRVIHIIITPDASGNRTNSNFISSSSENMEADSSIVIEQTEKTTNTLHQSNTESSGDSFSQSFHDGEEASSSSLALSSLISDTEAEDQD